MSKKLFFICLSFILLSNTYSYSKRELLLNQGLNKAYNLEFKAAEEIYNKVIGIDPDLPDGYFRISQLYFWSFLASHDIGQYYVFLKFAELAEKKLDFILSKNPKNAFYTYMAGNLASLRAMSYAINNSAVDALWYSKKAVKLFNTTLEINPKFYDAYLGLGLFDYAMSFVPEFLGWTLNIAGLSSNKARGLRYIKLAYDKGKYDRTEAAFHLSKIYVDYIAEYDSAEIYIKNLVSRYPANSLFLYQQALIQFNKRKLDYALGLFNKVLKINKEQFPQISALARFRIANIYFYKNEFSKALENFDSFYQTAREPDYLSESSLKSALCLKFLGNSDSFFVYLNRTSEGNPDLFEDAYAIKLASYFKETGVTDEDLFLIRMNNNLHAGKYKIVYDSLSVYADSLNGVKKGFAFLYLSEAAYHLKKYDEVVYYAENIPKINFSKFKWIIPKSYYLIAATHYSKKNYKKASYYLTLAKDNNKYDFVDYLEALIENLNRKLNKSI
ncbi:tetratricopeptide repeat protein [Melioribacter sp. OK-6-Me]|uniref:tetratricopeptide repeat protein n=1 Tax=unclassified Melioribacter TaxID=2627329 RepID=UPI003EDB1E4F